MRLVRTEVLRARSRRSVVLLLLLGLVVTGVMSALAAWDNRPDAPGFREPVDAGFVESLAEPLTVALMLIALLVGTTFVGAEYTSGSMSNLLLFEPRRLRVWVAKLTAVGLVATLWSVVCWAGFVGVLVGLGRSWDRAAWGPHWASDMAYFGARGSVIVIGAAVAGAALTLALRSTIATVGLAVGYLVVVEAIGNALFAPQVADYTVSNRVLGALHGRYVVRLWDGPEVERFVFSLRECALYLAVLGLLLMLASLIVFRRRDVD